MRIIVLGDEVTAGIGDVRGSGWPGRVIGAMLENYEQNTPSENTDLDYPVLINLACPGLTSTQIAKNWLSEVNRRRIPTEPTRIVIAAGLADLRQKISLPRIRLNYAEIMDAALREHLQVVLVGPPALDDISRDDIAILNDSLREVASRRNIPFIDIFNPLLAHEQWNTDLAQTNGLYPLQAGYSLIAYVILHSGWLDLN